MIFDKRELDRLGLCLKSDEFILVVDAARYVPSGFGSDGDFWFKIGTFENGAFHPVSSMDAVMDHRYPNAMYETLTGRFGEKSCRCGCPFILKRKLLEKQLYFVLHPGFKVQDADVIACGLAFEPMDGFAGLMYGFSAKAFRPGAFGGGNDGDVEFTLVSGRGKGAWHVTRCGFRMPEDTRFDRILFDAGRRYQWPDDSKWDCCEPARRLELPAFSEGEEMLFI